MKIIKKLVLISALMIGLIGCSNTNSTNPETNSPSTSTLAEKGSVDQSGMQINPKSVVGYVGDVMPFYEDGMMNMFYLQDGRNTYLGFHPFALMTSTDLVNWQDYGEVIPYENNIYSQDLALGTGSVIKDTNGLYHCFYTGHNSNKGSGLPYYEKIQHATSTDKINWTKHPEDGFYGGHNDFRDPYVYFSKEDTCYYMLVTTRVNDGGVIKRYSSTNLSDWRDEGVFFKNDAGSYNMECPTFIEYNGYYYLSYSEQGNHRVTHYRYKKNLTDEWIKPEVDYFDGEGFYAARMEKGFDKLMIFGWCGTKTGEFDFSGFDWAGNLVSHELVQLANGELRVKMLSEIEEAINTEVSYQTIDKKRLSDIEIVGLKKAYCFEALSKNITRMSFSIESKDLLGDCGLSFGTTANNILSNLIISFNFQYNTLEFYHNAANFADYGECQISVPFEYSANTEYNVDVIIDGEIITVYLDDTICLTTRMYDMPEERFSFYGNMANVKFANIKFYE